MKKNIKQVKQQAAQPFVSFPIATIKDTTIVDDESIYKLADQLGYLYYSDNNIIVAMPCGNCTYKLIMFAFIIPVIIISLIVWQGI